MAIYLNILSFSPRRLPIPRYSSPPKADMDPEELLGDKTTAVDLYHLGSKRLTIIETTPAINVIINIFLKFFLIIL
jgi:hypothetical protein